MTVKIKIPGTSLELSFEEIKAVVEFVLSNEAERTTERRRLPKVGRKLEDYINQEKEHDESIFIEDDEFLPIPEGIHINKKREEMLKKYKVNTGRLRDENGKINLSLDDVSPIFIKY